MSFSDVSCLYPPTQPLTVKYHLGSRVQTSPFDWIGIFPGQWEDVSQPAARISLPYNERSPTKARRKSVTFSAAAIKVSPGGKTQLVQSCLTRYSPRTQFDDHRLLTIPRHQTPRNPGLCSTASAPPFLVSS